MQTFDHEKFRNLVENRLFGFTMAEFAAAAGVKRRWIYKVMSGETTNPPFSMVARCLTVLRAKPEEVMSDTETT